MKLKFKALATCMFALAFCNPAFAQVPVTDVAQITVHQTNHIEDIAKWVDSIGKQVQQIEQLKAQYQQLQQQYQSMTGSRGLGNILNDPQYAQYLPQEWRDVYDRVRQGGYKGLTGTAQAIRDANKLYDSCAAKQGADQQVCQRQANKAAQDKAFASDAFDKAKARWEQIEGLVQQINGTTDPKAIAELQARIQGEQAALQNEHTKLQMFQMMAQAEDRLIEQQRREVNSKTWNSSGRGVSAQPLTFGH
ncbi:MAG: P-type DNA transfer protein VirB5 [Proteobacteria bacterium]|nr:P-type DNA transfer protein VirB5 [Pseudomonadota bacterium]